MYYNYRIVSRAYVRNQPPYCLLQLQENIGAQYAQSQWRFFSQYGEICPDNLWDFTPPVSPTLTPQPPPPAPHHHHQKDLVVIHYKTW